MQWLNELPFADNRVLQIGFLAACGIAALIVLAIFYRLAFAHRLRVPGGRTRQPRLGLVDAFSLDGQRQLVLVRRDNIEHLVMIGGPNDVLLESQINRAAAPARESSQVSPLLVPSTPPRRTEAATVTGSAPEAPAKAAAKAPASPPAPPTASPLPPSPPAQVPVAPVAPVAAVLIAPAPTAPIAAPSIPKAPAPAQPTAPVSAQASIPAQPSASEPARPDAAAPATTQAGEPARPAPASSPPRQPEPRPAQPRSGMPPPIIPANASPNRGAPVRVTETAPARGPSNPPAQSALAPAPLRRAEKAEPAVAGPRAEPAAATVKTEPPAASVGTTAPLASAALAQARPAPKTASDWAQRAADARPPADKTAAKNGKPLAKVDDPFADLDSLETEMARLLGREKSD
jgi:flagellar protein FliO/FliZ